MAWCAFACHRDPARLTVALAESITLRACIKPITFPFKLWASWKLVLASKTASHGHMAAMHINRVHRLTLASTRRRSVMHHLVFG